MTLALLVVEQAPLYVSVVAVSFAAGIAVGDAVVDGLETALRRRWTPAPRTGPVAGER